MLKHNSPQPFSPAITALLWVAVAIQTGGCDHAAGEVEEFGMFLVILLRPHADDSARSGAHLLFAARNIDAECLLLHRGRPANAPLYPAARNKIDRGDLFRNAGGMDEFVRHQRNTKTQLDPLGNLRQRAQHHFVAGHMRPVLAKMVFDAPDCVKTLLVGKGDLFKVFLVDPALFHALAPRVRALPGLRHIEFVK